MNYQITCVCGHRFFITDQQLTGHVTCPACQRALMPVVTPAPTPVVAPTAVPAMPTGTPTAGPEMKAENTETAMTTELEPTKRCPFCGEVILAIAKKCKHCGEFLDRSAADAVVGQARNAQVASTSGTDAPAAGTDDAPVFELSVSQWDNFWKYLICVTIAVAVTAGLVMLPKSSITPQIKMVIDLVTLILMVAMAWSFYVRTRNSRCIIRPMRIETEVGVLMKELTAVDLFRVTDLKLDQGIVQRILGIGTIQVISNDPQNPNLTLYQIPQVRKVYKYLQQQVPIAARQRGAVYLER